MSCGGVTGGRAASGNGGEKGDDAMSGGGVLVLAPWSCVYDRLQENLYCGEPDLRPECGHIMLTRTEGMVKREQEYYDSALVINLAGKVHVMLKVLVVRIVLARIDELTVHRGPIKSETKGGIGRRRLHSFRRGRRGRRGSRSGGRLLHRRTLENRGFACKQSSGGLVL
jgi:hypothetical protein